MPSLDSNVLMEIGPTTPIFLMGLGVGTGLLVLGLILGAWIGRRSSPPAANPGMDPQQFLMFMHNLSRWTNEVSVDVSKYQNQINTLTRRVDSEKSSSTKEEVQDLIRQIMNANHQLQTRLENAEEKLECQTKEIANYLTEARTDGLTGLANRRAVSSLCSIAAAFLLSPDRYRSLQKSE